MTDDTVVAQRRRFVESLRELSLVEAVDFTRDGYETVVLTLGDSGDTGPDGLAQCPVCGATGLEERIENHDCEEFREWRAER